MGEHRLVWKQVVTDARHARVESLVNYNAPGQIELCSGPFSAKLRGRIGRLIEKVSAVCGAVEVVKIGSG